MLFATKPVLTSQKKGPARGFIVMGRFLDAAMNRKLADQTKVDFTICPIDKSCQAANGNILSQIAQTQSLYIHHTDENRLEIYTTLADIEAKPAILLRADLPRDIYQRGISAMEYTRFASVLINIAVLITLMIWLQVAVIGPLLKLTNHAEKVAQSDNLATRLNMKRKDEIGTLARGFDFMLDKLARARTELMERSYKWGKAEMASGVLHNLRNSLSPVVARIEFMREDIQKAPLDTIQTAQQQLAQEDTSVQRKADLQRFIELANGNLEGLCRRMKGELEDLSSRTMQIEQMLGDQDILRHAGCPVEPATIEQLVGNSKKMMPDALCKDISIEISPDAATIGCFECDKISVSQIFANLLINSAESIRRAGVPKGRIGVGANIEKDEAVEMLHIRLTDNGGGIAAQDVGRVFERGFTTKPQKELSGIGLHWCANTVGAMGGRMWAQSEGIGRGACIHLVLPLHPQKKSGTEKIR
jgi:two-component system, NtrC family, sensor kinase